MRRRVRRWPLIVAAVLLAGGSLGVPLLVAADNAPMWESPVGLTPGLPDTQVRMAAENVDIQIVERGSAAVAVVSASFDMDNPGPDASMLVGFPGVVESIIVGTPALKDTGYSPVTFGDISNFRAWTDTVEYATTVEEVNTVGAWSGTKWYVWSMTYPSGARTRVNVAYEQTLGDQAYARFVQPTYVLRTGALWAGTIGDATVTLTAVNGGGLVGADGATSATDTQIVWHFSDFEPTADVGTAYVFADRWSALRAAETAIAGGAPTADDYLSGAQAAFEMLGTYGAYGIPSGLLDRYATPGRDWAWRAKELAPDRAASWEVVGDAETFFASPTHKNHGELDCWPYAGADAYQHAVDQGSPTAADKLATLHQRASGTEDMLGRALVACG
jgi:hypothetical protein